MPRRYPPEVRRQVIDLARSGTRVPQLAATFGMSEATIYNWLKQEKVDRGEIDGRSTDQALELTVAKRRIRQLETELALSRKVNEVFLSEGLDPKALPGDRVSDRAGNQREARLPRTRRVGVGLLRVEGPSAFAEDPQADLVSQRDR